MTIATIGIICALLTMLSWGIGDFLIQRSTRKFGNWETLFLITFFGAIVLLPFTFSKISTFLQIGGAPFWIIIIASATMLVAAITEFESLRIGKISIVEPIWSMEIPVSVFLAFVILRERLSVAVIVLIVALLTGLILLSAKEKGRFKKMLFEKGAVVALLGAILMGSTNFFVGWGARETDPLMVNFVMNVILLVISGGFLIIKGKFFKTFSDLKQNTKPLLIMMILDNGAWIAFAYAMIYAPIGIAVALSESYIIIAVMLGIFVNKETLQGHQKIGLVVAIISAVILAILAT